jgi:hypothetical protein
MTISNLEWQLKTRVGDYHNDARLQRDPLRRMAASRVIHECRQRFREEEDGSEEQID